MRQRQPRKHDPGHLAFVRSLPCVVCGNDIETEAAHVRFAAPHAGKRQTGKGEKPDDRWTIPMCGKCHDEQHEGSEAAFWQSRGIDPLFIAMALYGATGDYEAGMQIVSAT